ncbi:hypothetical protein DRQ09_08435, partial [candidate division KSB1 bacterium]
KILSSIKTEYLLKTCSNIPEAREIITNKRRSELTYNNSKNGVFIQYEIVYPIEFNKRRVYISFFLSNASLRTSSISLTK